MSVNDFAIVALLWTAFSTALRGEMLRERLDPRPDIPRPTYSGNWPMIIAMDIAALAFVGWALEIAWGTGAFIGWGAFAVCCSAAMASTVILASMIGHNWREAIRAKDQKAVTEVEASIPAALDKGVQRFMDQPKTY